MKDEATSPAEKRKVIESLLAGSSHFDEYVSSLVAQGWDEVPLRSTISQALDKINAGVKSFVIYGEPQSGKTAMMIGLTSKLIESGHELVVILLNDSVKLLNQNLERFIRSKISPTPREATSVYETGFTEKKHILFCKKNIHDLRKLSEMTKNRPKIIIDDEADYASPNAKINKDERTAINNAIFRILETKDFYIGVTATPARLDLNNTFDTDNEQWVYFEPHRDYVGKNEIFLEKPICQKFAISSNEKSDLEKAVIAFIVNTVYLNCENVGRGKPLEYYGFLIHTSHKIADHRTDADIVQKILGALADDKYPRHGYYIKEIEDYIKKHSEIEGYGAENIVKLIEKYIASKRIIIMNCNFDTRGEDTKPQAMFTFFIGGNVVSRGVTFDNLLGMFFTRSAKHNIQQDTYIQRARMFGSRKAYIKYFQLWIPEALFEDWQQCFIYHYISLQSIQATQSAPIWLSGGRLVPAATSSIDKRNIFTMKGEVVSRKFFFGDVETRIDAILKDSLLPELIRLEKIREFLPVGEFLDVILQFIKLTSEGSKSNINLIKTRPVSRKAEHHDRLYRTGKEAIMTGGDYKDKSQDHHIMFIVNEDNQARLVYRYSPRRIRFFSKVGKNYDY